MKVLSMTLKKHCMHKEHLTPIAEMSTSDCMSTSETSLQTMQPYQCKDVLVFML